MTDLAWWILRHELGALLVSGVIFFTIFGAGYLAGRLEIVSSFTEVPIMTVDEATALVERAEKILADRQAQLDQAETDEAKARASAKIEAATERLESAKQQLADAEALEGASTGPAAGE